jgi:hypothetical protein
MTDNAGYEEEDPFDRDRRSVIKEVFFLLLLLYCQKQLQPVHACSRYFRAPAASTCTAQCITSVLRTCPLSLSCTVGHCHA